MSIALRFAARSDLGLGAKARNEDSGYASPDLLILADGMGGHAAGDMASATVVEELEQLDGQSWAADEALQQLKRTVLAANDRLRAEMDAAPELEGMGTTLIAFLRSGDKLALANIGDSRAYLWRDGVFSQVTKDHSFVQALLDDGRITEEEALHHPQRSLVTRVLTGRVDDEPDLSLREAQVGDRLLLCSDGLSDYVAHARIEEIMGSDGDPAQWAEELISIALKSATRDNVTVVVAEVIDGADLPNQAPQLVGAAATQEDSDDPATQEMAAGSGTPAGKAAALLRQVRAEQAAGLDEYDEEDEDEADGPLLAEEGPRKHRWWLRFGIAFIALILLGAAGTAGYVLTQQQYYVAAHDGKVTIYRGITQNLGPISLHSVNEPSDIYLADLPSFYRSKVSSGMTASSKSDAEQIVENLRLQMVHCQQAEPISTSCTQ